MKSINFDMSAINLVESYLKNLSRKLVFQNVSSDWIDLYQGVPQGRIFRPLLFNRYVRCEQYDKNHQ